MIRVAQPQAQRPNEDLKNGTRSFIDLTSDDEEHHFADAFEEPQSNLMDELSVGQDQQFHEHSMVNDLAPGALEDSMERRPECGNPNAEPAIMNPLQDHDVWGNYIIDEDFDEEALANVLIDLEHDYRVPTPKNPPPVASAPPAPAPSQQPILEAAGSGETKVECLDNVIAVFPGICQDHVSGLYNSVSKSSERLIAYILDKMDKGAPYPKAKDKQKSLKRKREVDEDEEAARKYGAIDRVMPAGAAGIRPYM